MKKKQFFSVNLEKTLYCTGSVNVQAESEDKAIELIEARIDKGELQTTAIMWGDPTYEDMSFKTTGDVE